MKALCNGVTVERNPEGSCWLPDKDKLLHRLDVRLVADNVLHYGRHDVPSVEEVSSTGLACVSCSGVHIARAVVDKNLANKAKSSMTLPTPHVVFAISYLAEVVEGGVNLRVWAPHCSLLHLHGELVVRSAEIRLYNKHIAGRNKYRLVPS